MLSNQPYAETLRAIAAGGADAFYKRQDRRATSSRPSTAIPTNPGGLSLADLAGYQVKERAGGLRALSRLSRSAAWDRPPPAR